MATKLYLPNLLEFIYNAIVSRGKNYLFDRLDRDDFQKIKTDSKARGFAEHANLEEKLILLSKIGLGCAVIIWDKEKEKKSKVEDVVISYINTDQNDVTKQLIKDKVFGCRDIDFIKSLQTISHSCSGRVYSINRKFLHIKENAIKTRILENKLEAQRNLEWYSKTISFAFEIEQILETFKIDIIQFRILLYLHTLPNGATKEFLNKKLNRTNITGMINEMYNQNMVDLAGEEKNIVTIGVYGIIILDQIFSKFP